MLGDPVVITQKVKAPHGGSLISAILAPFVVPVGYQAPLPAATGPAPTPESRTGLVVGLVLAALVLGGGFYLVFKEND
jgi:hypothetical protein